MVVVQAQLKPIPNISVTAITVNVLIGSLLTVFWQQVICMHNPRILSGFQEARKYFANLHPVLKAATTGRPQLETMPPSCFA
jgi:hypothetical protein